METLKKQLERSRLERCLAIAEDLAAHKKLLTTLELERINNILAGKKENEDPWRKSPATLTLPSGRTETYSLIADPKLNTREKLHRATELADMGDSVESGINAAVDIYSQLVMLHAFEDANRRTAVVACHYFLRRYKVNLSGLAIHELGLGDLREPGQIESLRQTVHQMVKFTTRKP